MAMILRIQDREGRVAFIDNEGQKVGTVRIQGDPPLVSHLNHLINLDIDLPFQTMKETVGQEFTVKLDDGRTVLNKASDHYLKTHFLAVECPVFGYTAEVLKE
jgi:hypothetical protein